MFTRVSIRYHGYLVDHVRFAILDEEDEVMAILTLQIALLPDESCIVDMIRYRGQPSRSWPEGRALLADLVRQTSMARAG